MYLSKNNKSGIWYVYYRKANGNKTRISTGANSKTDALRFLNDFQKNVKLREKKTDIKLSEFALRYYKHISVTHTDKSYRLTKRTIIPFIDTIGSDSLIQDFTKAQAESYIFNTFARAKHHAHLQLRILKAFFNKGIEWEYIEKNPFKGIKLQIPENFPEFITSEDLKTLVDKAEGIIFANIYKFAFYTGMRISEILNLEWSDINLKTEEIRVKNKKNFSTKSKRERIIPITKNIIQILNDQKNAFTEIKTNLIFNKCGVKLDATFVSKKFKKCIRAAGLNDTIHFHSLRHSFCSNLVAKGVSLYIVKVLAGHQSIITTQRYSHLKKESLEKAISLLD